MREIKFQAVNDEGKIIIPDYIDRHGIAWWKENSIPECTRRIRQFTGLKDKNGREIYEGDIIESKSWGSGARLKNPYHFVEWGKCGWVATGYNGNMKVSPDLTIKSDFEIIGNIYENPELL